MLDFWQTEAVDQICSVKKFFFKISQNSQENTCARVSFLIKVAGLMPATLLKKRLWRRCFPVNFVKFLRTSFWQNTSGRLLLSFIEKINGFCEPCKKWRCEICDPAVYTKSFKLTTTQRTYSIRPENLKCSSENAAYLFTFKTCYKQYTCSKFDQCSKTIDVAIENFWKSKKLKEDLFNPHFAKDK